MSCKLFDIAAFGGDGAAKVAHTNGDALKTWRRGLRKCVFLDASRINSVWTDWLTRPGDYRDELLKTTPPWRDVFVFGGREFSPQFGQFDFGLQLHLMDANNDDWKLATKNAVGWDDSEPFRPVAHVIHVRMWLKAASRMFVVLCNLELLFLSAEGQFINSVILERSDLEPGTNQSMQWSLALFAFQLLHCRNIETRESVYRPHMPKGRRNKAPKIAYHTLQISDTLVKREGQEPSGEHPGVAKHVVRGNFAHYTDENKLFGKYTGMFWRPMHIRGEARHGIVGKEYELATPSLN